MTLNHPIIRTVGVESPHRRRSVRPSNTRMAFLLAVRGQRPVTAELALRLGRYFRQSPRFWLNLQGRYDMDVTQDEMGKLVEREVQPLKAVA